MFKMMNKANEILLYCGCDAMMIGLNREHKV